MVNMDSSLNFMLMCELSWHPILVTPADQLSALSSVQLIDYIRKSHPMFLAGAGLVPHPTEGFRMPYLVWLN